MTFKRLMAFGGVVLASAFFLRCGEGPEGFNARYDWSISVLSTGSVSVPSGTEDVPVVIKVLDDASLPANGISLTLTCTRCVFVDDPDGPHFPTADLSGFVEVEDPYIVKTGDNGTYTLFVRVQSPANSVEASYSAKIFALSGPITTTGSISVTL